MQDDGFSRSCYYICMAVIGYSVAGYLILQWLPLSPDIVFPSCRLYQRTGYYCMGCGGTRALRLFFRGHLIQSFYYHPIVDVVMVFLCVFIPSHTLSILTKGRIHGLPLKPVYFYVLIGILILQWAVKNGIFYFTGIHVI
jgi:Protein of unknown function (DUF2752).